MVLRVFPEYHVENKSALAAEKLRCPVIKHVQLSAKGEPIGHPPRGLVFFKSFALEPDSADSKLLDGKSRFTDK